MDSLALRAVVAELGTIHGSRVERVTATGPWDLALQLERNTTLTVCVHPTHDALFLGPPGNESDATSPFLRAAGAALTRSRLDRVVQRGLDRVVAVVFERRDRLGDRQALALVAELTGPGANLWLTEGTDPWGGKIRERLRGERSTGGRRMTPGGIYSPPARSGPDAGESDPELLASALRPSLEEHGRQPRALVAAWAGVSPAAAREVWARAEDRAEAAPEELVRLWIEFRDAVAPPSDPAGTGRGSSFQPCLRQGSRAWDALPWLPSPDPAPEGTTPPLPTSTMNEAVAEAHRRQQEAGGSGAGVGPLARAVSRAAARVDRALAALSEEGAGNPEDLRTAAEALLAAAHDIPPGAAETEIPDPHAGGKRRIRLNPKLGPVANAELYFKRARKAERRAGRSGQRRSQLLEQRRALTDLDMRLAAGGEAAADEAWRQEAHDHGVVLPSPPLTESARSAGGDLPGAIRPRRYDLGGGWTALVGRSSRGNEVLTHEIARPDEVWMHADQAAGSHLVLRHAERGRKPPESVVLAAAAIAAWFSKSRHSGKVPVLVTEKRHVRRARRAPIGTVLVGTHRNLMVAPRNPAGEES